MSAAVLQMLPAQAQQLDLDDSRPSLQPARPMPMMPVESRAESVNLSPGKPLTATVSKSLYLPPEMYGQWNITGKLIETNVPNSYPVATDIWILEREGDVVVVTNPANGASAQVNVDQVEGETATFHKVGRLGSTVKTETVTVTVNGDTLFGKNMIRDQKYAKDGSLVRDLYAVFTLQGTRIGGARTTFRPETSQGPDIEIEEPQIQR